MVLNDFLHLTVTEQLAFDLQESNSACKFNHVMDRCCHTLVSKLKTSDTPLEYDIEATIRKLVSVTNC